MPRPKPIYTIPVIPVSRFDYMRHFKPQLLFIPCLVGLIRNKPRDDDLKKLLRTAKVEANQVLENYGRLQARTKVKLYGRNYRDGESYNKSLKEILVETSNEYKEKMRIEGLRKKEAVRKKLAEFKEKPLSEIMQIAPADAYEFIAMQKYVRWYWRRLVPCCETSGGEDSTEGVAGNVPLPPNLRYAFRINKMKCNEQEDWTGDDDIYFLSVAVDGNGNVVPLQSPAWEMDTSQTRSIWWNIYPMQDPNNYLDISVRMYEVNGSYEPIGNTLLAMGAASVGVNAVAGAIVAALGAFVSLLGWLDEDDDLGTHNFTYNGASNLHTSVGVIPRSYLGDGADYDVSFQLIEGQ